jgi:AcrR family transcriptional regulator
MTAAYSAQGTRLNRRGVQTRQRVLDAAVERLATGGPDALSANLIARDAGVTWGTIQHQFGDADGVWAAVIDHTTEQAVAILAKPPRTTVLRRRVTDVVNTMWLAYDSKTARAVHNLRLALPHDPVALSEEYPETARRLLQVDQVWASSWAQLFTGLSPSKAKVRNVSTMLPAAVSGLHTRAELASFGQDAAIARTCLIDAVTAYLR